MRFSFSSQFADFCLRSKSVLLRIIRNLRDLDAIYEERFWNRSVPFFVEVWFSVMRFRGSCDILMLQLTEAPVFLFLLRAPHFFFVLLDFSKSHLLRSLVSCIY